MVSAVGLVVATEVSQLELDVVGFSRWMVTSRRDLMVLGRAHDACV